MLSVAAACCAGAVWCWPARSTWWRVPVRDIRPRAVAGVIARRLPLLALTAVPAAVWLGPWVPAAVVLAGCVAVRRWRAVRRVRRRDAATAQLGEALHGMITELRRGAHPALAASAVAETAVVGPLFTTIADAAQLGARVEEGLATRIVDFPHLRAELERFATAWRLSTVYGLPLAELLTALHRDIEYRVRATAKVHAQLSGARASGWVLAALPVFGVGIGQLIGADPIGVLAGGGLGGMLLLVGTVLIAAGLTWTARLTERVVPQ